MTEFTTRLLLPYTNSDGEESPDGPGQFRALATALDSAFIWRGKGNFSARPPFGVPGAIWVSIDQNPKLVSVDIGTQWVDLVLSTIIGNAQLGDDVVDERVLAPLSVGAAEIILAAIGTAHLADASVTYGKLAAGLKPSGSANGGDEALRALGTATGTAAAGNDARIPTQAENDALQGSYGIPSNTNRFVTATDPKRGLYDRKVSQTWMPVSDATLRTMYTKTIKGGDLGADGQIEVEIWGLINSIPTTHPGFTMSLEFGGAVVFASMWPGMNGSNGGSASFRQKFVIMNVDVSHQVADLWHYGGGFGSSDLKMVRTTGLNVDTTADKDLVLKGQFTGGASASNSLIVDQMTMKIR